VDAVATWSTLSRPREDASRPALAVALAFGLHLLFALTLVLLSVLGIGRRPPPVSKQAVSLRAISDADWQRVRQAAFRADKVKMLPPPAPPKVKFERPPKGQVVAVPKGNGEVAPDAKFLAESNNAVKHQTRAKETTSHYEQAEAQTSTPKPREAETHEQVKFAHTRGNGGEGQSDALKREASTRRNPQVASLGVTAENILDRGPGLMRQSPLLGGPKRQEGEEERAASEGRKGLDSENSTATPAAQAGRQGAAANDHLKDVDEGGLTALNTREFKFAGFMNRVKQAISSHWEPREALARHRINLGASEVQTVVAVVLTPEGRVKDLRVVQSSGYEALDEEAIAAFSRSQPYPNPPRQLVEEDGFIHFGFGFVMEQGGGPAQYRYFRPGL
jgi:TonB family protein